MGGEPLFRPSNLEKVAKPMLACSALCSLMGFEPAAVTLPPMTWPYASSRAAHRATASQLAFSGEFHV